MSFFRYFFSYKEKYLKLILPAFLLLCSLVTFYEGDSDGVAKALLACTPVTLAIVIFGEYVGYKNGKGRYW